MAVYLGPRQIAKQNRERVLVISIYREIFGACMSRQSVTGQLSEFTHRQSQSSRCSSCFWARVRVAWLAAVLWAVAAVEVGVDTHRR